MTATERVASPLLPTYARTPITIVSGEGCELVDDRGRRYLDFLAGIAVCALGHAHPAIAGAVAEQARRLVHVSNLYHHEPSETLAAKLVELSGLSGVFFCNSGTEANEAAIKLTRKLAHRNGETQRTTILACEGSFHGRTMGALAATANARYREGFEPLPAGFAFVPFNDCGALERAIDGTVAAFIVEPVQGESGVRVATPEFLETARRLCDERGALLIFDEVQCGTGRLGSMFAFQTFGVVPDVVTLAKALANGLPIGALIAGPRAAEGFAPGDHGSTFGGSPVPAAAALVHLRLREELSLDAAVRQRSERLFAGLRLLLQRHARLLSDVRGVGLMAGLEVREPWTAAGVADAARERGLLIGTAGGNTVRLTPPLIVNDAQIDRGITVLNDVFYSMT
ncbi:MAG TPA: aspartate aminotransferase family protein [Candidatus Tumulicola sp.]